MNPSKRKMIIISIVLSFIAAFANLVTVLPLVLSNDAFLSVLSEYNITFASADIVFVVLIILTALEVVLICGGNALLLVSIKNKGEHFKERKSVFIFGAILCIISGPTSIYAILLYVALTMKDWETMCPPTEDYIFKSESNNNGTTVEVSPKLLEMQKKINDLKMLRDAGQISEEDYKKILSELL